MASDLTPQSAAGNSKRSTPVDASKKSSTTQEAEGERRDRSFQECIEFLMPVYLLPFVFWDKAHHKHPAKSATGAPHHKQLVELPGDPKAEADRRAPIQSAPKQRAVLDPTPGAKFDPVPTPKPALKQQPKAEVKPEARAEQEPEQRPEIRGVLKNPNPSTQPITGSHSGSVASSSKPMHMPMENGVWNLGSRVAGRGELARTSSELNLTEQRKLLTRQASLASEHQAGPSSSCEENGYHFFGVYCEAR